MKSKKIVFYLLIVSSVLLGIYICFKLVNFFNSFKYPEILSKYLKDIESFGFWGFIILLLVQILQVFIAFIPGEVVEILSGMIYGAVLGLVLCLLGILIASILIYYSIKLFFKENIIQKYKKKLSDYSFLNNPKKIYFYFFIIFLIPGFPKDIFIYLVPFLPIKLSSFLIISLIARIPSILSSTLVGSSFVNGNFSLSIIIFIIFMIFGIIGFLFGDKIIARFKKKDINTLNDNLEN